MQEDRREFTFGRGIVFCAGLFIAIYVFTNASDGGSDPANNRPETYRLIQAIGNSEHESARGLSKAECEARKSDLKKVATALGTYDENTGLGSITCLPESSFKP